MRKLIIPIVIASILAGCKEYVAPELEPSTDPIFEFQGDIEGSFIEIKADGSHKAYSEVSVDSLGVTVYEGWLASCANCPPRFHFEWRASDESNPDLIATTMDANPPIRYALSNDSIIFYDISLDARVFGTVSTYKWNILGQRYSSASVDMSVEHDDELTKFPVSLEVSYANGCSAMIIDTVYLPHHGCDCGIEVEMQDSLLYTYEAVASGGANYTYAWQFENGESVPSRQLTYQYPQLPTDGVEEVSLQINTGDCIANRKEQHFFPMVNSGCAVNVAYNIATRIEVEPGRENLDLGEVSLSYMDPDGTEYVSYLVKQATNGFFEVEQVEAYLDPFQEVTSSSMKVDARFNALFTDGKDTIRVTDARFTLPIGLGAL